MTAMRATILFFATFGLALVALIGDVAAQDAPRGGREREGRGRPEARPTPGERPRRGPPSFGERGERGGRQGMSRGWRGLSAEARAERETFRREVLKTYDDFASGNAEAKKMERRFDRMARQVAFSASPETFERLRALGPADRVRAVVKEWLDQRDRQDERVLNRLGDEARTAVAGLEGEARHRAIRDLEANALLESAIEKAQTQGLIADDEAARLRQLDAEGKIGAVRGIHRNMVLFVHRGEIDEAETRRLEGLSDGDFFRDPFVRRLRFGPQLDREQLRALRRLDPTQRRGLLAALRESEGATALGELEFLGAETREALVSMNEEQRKRFAHQLDHMLFRSSRAFRPPRGVFERLSEEDRRRFMGLDDDAARFALLAEKLPDVDWAKARRSWEAMEELRQTFGEEKQLMWAFFRQSPEEFEKTLEASGLDETRRARVRELLPRIDREASPFRRGRR
ncbi:MAG: hypothetical protein R3F20_19700 [Planctomycetota bacterium]